MKKLLSVLFSAVMLVCFIFGGQAQAFANTKKTAPSIQLYSAVSASVNYNEKKYLIKFVPDSTGYYEFICTAIPQNTMVLGSIVDYADEVIMQNTADATSTDFIVAAELTANVTYYFELESDGTPYSTNVVVRAHNHSFNVTQTYPAVYDANDSELCDDGGSYTFCAYCGEYITNATYFAPSMIKTGADTFTYNGKKKTTSVTVYDRVGNVIAPSNYKVSYKSNLNPGFATVTVAMNGVNYVGTFTKKLTIKPKKLSIKSLKSSKPKALTVKWKKDSKVSGYQVRYSTSKKFYKSKTKTINVSKKSTSKTVSKLKGKKKYYVQVRSYKTSAGKKIYSDWSKAKAVAVKK